MKIAALALVGLASALMAFLPAAYVDKQQAGMPKIHSMNNFIPGYESDLCVPGVASCFHKGDFRGVMQLKFPRPTA